MTNKENTNSNIDEGIAGSGCDVLVPFNERLPIKDVEKSITKKYRSRIWSEFIKAIKDYNMVEEGDKIAVAISGGKDSMLMAKLFQELKKHKKVNFEIEFIVMDPGYHENIRELMIDNCNYLNIPIKIFEGEVFKIIDNIAKEYPCYMCARIRRGRLYEKAKELGCNKLALGHHFNDVIETTLINMFYGGTFGTMLPKLKSRNFEGIELIRPMYYIKEKDIEDFTQSSGIWPLNCACMVAAKKISNKRYEIKELIEKLKETNEDIDKSIFKSSANVDMGAILGWYKEEEEHKYLDFY